MRALSITRRLTSFCSGSSRAFATRQLEEFLALDLDGIGGDGRRRGLAPHRIAHQRHLADEMTRANFADQNLLATLAARQRDTARAQHEQRVADFAFLEQHFAA